MRHRGGATQLRPAWFANALCNNIDLAGRSAMLTEAFNIKVLRNNVKPKLQTVTPNI